MSEVKLDSEERELLDSYEAREWRSVSGIEAEAQRYREYARALIASIIHKYVSGNLVERRSEPRY